jgi:hypothetical protein
VSSRSINPDTYLRVCSIFSDIRSDPKFGAAGISCENFNLPAPPDIRKNIKFDSAGISWENFRIFSAAKTDKKSHIWNIEFA